VPSTETPQPGQAAAQGLSRLWEDLAKRDFARTTDTELGLPAQLRPHISRHFFNEEVLEGDHPEVHKDRDRARDVIRYRWSGDRLVLREHDTVEIRDRSGFMGSRTVTRVELLTDPLMTTWIRTVLGIVPPHLRQEEGTFGVNFMRTRTTVVSGPHQDEEEYVLVYVVDKHGGGAETTLHRAGDPDDIVHRMTLTPGDLLIFRDAAFLHSVTPLTPVGSSPTRRDALVCTVNYPDTYDLT
jgi:hypothetical protein